jgi:hypothetical protein
MVRSVQASGLGWQPATNLDMIFVTIKHGRRKNIFLLYLYIYMYTVTTFKYAEGGPDREAPEVV